MAHFHNDDLEYVGDDYYDVVDFEDNPFLEPEPQREADLDYIDSDFEDDFESVCYRSRTNYMHALLLLIRDSVYRRYCFRF